MSIIACSVNECEYAAHRTGLCSSHYAKSLKSARANLLCKWPECPKSADVVKCQLCTNHYAKARRIGDLESPWEHLEALKAKANSRTCRWPDCDTSGKSLKASYCQKHYLRAWKLSNFENPWEEYRPYNVPTVTPPCKWVGCDRESEYAGYCSRDYSRAKAVGNFENPWDFWEVERKCKVCGQVWKQTANRAKEFCSNVCNAKSWKKDNPERAQLLKRDASIRRRALKEATQVEKFSVSDVRAAKGDECYLCSLPIQYSLKFPDPWSPSLDHIIPLSKGGAHTVENTAMTHLRCNLRKGVSILAATA